MKALVLHVPAGFADSVCDSLLEAGAQSALIEDARAGTESERPVYGEPGSSFPGASGPGAIWEDTVVRALLDDEADVAALVVLAGKACLASAPLPHRIEEVPEDDWVRRSQAQFHAINPARGIWIVPSWQEPPDPGALNIRLDPGLAFGTGSHATTQLCLRWLQQRVSPDRTFLDYGCGSGILAIAAALLGARAVYGIDIDPDALSAARLNARRNGAEVRFLDASAPLSAQFDLVAANILANPLRVLAPVLARHVVPEGQLALSGILESQCDELSLVYEPYFRMRRFSDQEGWVCLEGTRR